MVESEDMIKLDEQTEKYIESIRYELSKLKENRFTGNRSFRLNFKEGSVANMNLTSEKSVKL